MRFAGLSCGFQDVARTRPMKRLHKPFFQHTESRCRRAKSAARLELKAASSRFQPASLFKRQLHARGVALQCEQCSG